MAGTRNNRTMVASMRTATASMNPSMSAGSGPVVASPADGRTRPRPHHSEADRRPIPGPDGPRRRGPSAWSGPADHLDVSVEGYLGAASAGTAAHRPDRPSPHQGLPIGHLHRSGRHRGLAAHPGAPPQSGPMPSAWSPAMPGAGRSKSLSTTAGRSSGPGRPATGLPCRCGCGRRATGRAPATVDRLWPRIHAEILACQARDAHRGPGTSR